MALAFVARVGPGSGRDAIRSAAETRDPISAPAHELASGARNAARPSGTASSDVALAVPITGLVSAIESSSRRAPLGSGPVPRAHRHRAIAPPDVEPIAVARLGRDVKAVVLGDSYTSGWNGAGIGSRGWPALVGANRGWKVVNLSVAGTGFMNPGWTGRTIGSRVDAAVRQKPGVVIVAGGHNDSAWAASTTSRAAVSAIDHLHAALPDALIVIVAPIWQNGSPPTRCLILRDALRRKAAEIGAVFIDPLAEHWFAGPSHRFIGSDGLHPTNAGHAWLATRILAGLSGV
jgi:lysophospholipase L1-like esterase